MQHRMVKLLLTLNHLEVVINLNNSVPHKCKVEMLGVGALTSISKQHLA